MHYKAAWACGQAALRLAHMPTRRYDHHRLSPLVSTRNDEGPKVETKKTGFLHQQETGFLIGSLTMTYFHTGIRTIIGAESFHCPVRDGKEWDQLAMVIRLKRFLTWCVYNANQISQFAESINVSASILIASRREHHALRDTHRPNVFRFKQSDRRRY